MKRKGFRLIIITGQILVTMAAVVLLNPDCNKKTHIILAGLFFYIAGLITIYSYPRPHYNMSVAEKLFNFFRLLRHDFQNHLQVLYSMIQLKKYENALKYINEVNNSDKVINYICNNLTDLSSICCLLEIAYSLKQKNVDLEIEICDEGGSLARANHLKNEMQKYILKFDESQSKKEIKIVFKDSNIELHSEALGKKVIHVGKHFA
ncbi:MAG: Spo0B domain-containing protein [Tepidanaerobacteraceae bacterium]|nr:Spo0B domain-containing protein [Tepidanaerobacteraceae bacterium]